jgi:Cu/Ag efflux pump CusA
MVRKLIDWSLSSPLIVLLMAVALACAGYYSFIHINVEAYPDPAPAVIEIVAQWGGWASLHAAIRPRPAAGRGYRAASSGANQTTQ